MTTSPSSHFCMECGLPCAPRQRFCGDECFDLWTYGPGKGATLNPGYSLIAPDLALIGEQTRQAEKENRIA